MSYMLQIIFHLFGDYITQNHWMAKHKIEFTSTGWIACFIHCILYSLPFLLLRPSVLAFVVIFGTHFLIDKFRLAKYFIQLRDWNFKNRELQPAFISVWLLIIADNTFHITINFLAIEYL